MNLDLNLRKIKDNYLFYNGRIFGIICSLLFLRKISDLEVINILISQVDFMLKQGY